MAVTTTIASRIDRGFYANTILNIFANMTRGKLSVTMPDGEEIIIGEGEGNVHAAISVHSQDFFKRCVLYGDIGFGEAYTDGSWDSPNITNVIKWFLLNIENAPAVSGSRLKSAGLNFLKIINKLSHLKKQNTLNGSRKNIAAHYDLDNEFFALFLDPTMTYSAAYFEKEGMSLQDAQEAKYDRLCRRLDLQPDDSVLEIGSGWGANAIYMAKNYGCTVTTLTISEEQFKLAKERVTGAGVEDRVTVLLQDYRTMTGSFDKIVSIEMIEAVGHKFLNVYFRKITELLKPQGIFALQAITCPDSRYNDLRKGVDWIQKHIFPGSLLPSVAAINKAINRAGTLNLIDLKDLGLHYAATLDAWREQFSRNLPHIRSRGFDESFIRRWNYYFSYCEAAFAMRNINVLQMVYVRPNVVIN